MDMDKFAAILKRAVRRKGGLEAVEARLPKMKSAAALRKVGDDRYLSEMAKCVFRAGFNWRVVDMKWPAFEEVFFQFDPQRVTAMTDEQMDALMARDDIIRHGKKLRSVQKNAQFIRTLAERDGSAAACIAAWPSSDAVGFLALMKREGDRLGGNTGQMFLRMVGKDCFVLSRDVVAALIAMNIVDKAPGSKSSMAKVQSAFNMWTEESGRPMAHVSRILAMSVDS